MLIRLCRRAARIIEAAALSFAALTAAPAIAKPPPLAMEVFGRGPAVVFESGLGEGRDSWREVARGLALCLTVVLYDRPGIGGSPAPQDPGNPVLAAAVADDLLVQLRDHGLPGPFLLVGHHSAGSTSKHSPATIPMKSRAWCLSMRQARLSRRASSSRGCRQSLRLSRPPRRQESHLLSLRSWRARHCHPCRSSSSPQRTTVTRPRARRFGAMCSSDLPRPHRRAGSSLSTAATSSKKTRPEDVIAAVLSVAADTGADIKACRC